MRSLNVDSSQVEEFFSTLYPENPWPGVIFVDFQQESVDPGRRGILRDRIHLTEPESVKRQVFTSWSKMQSEGSHIYFTCAFYNFNSKKRTKQDVFAISTLWADVDYVDDYGLKDLLADCPLPPTMIVRSGNGVHIYWRLKTYSYETEPKGPCEIAVQRVHKWVGGDHTHNLNRILRVPGTYNVKTKHGDNPPICKIIHKDVSISYALEDILAVKLSYKEIKTTDVFREKYILRGECDINEVTGKRDRSKRDFIIAREMASHGHTNEEIEYVLKNPAYGCSDKALDPSVVTDYVQRTIQEGRSAADTTQSGFKVYDNGSRIIKRQVSKNLVEQEIELSNFCLIPQRRVLVTDGSDGVIDELLDCQVRYGKEGLKDVCLDAGDLSHWKILKKKAALPMAAFYGMEHEFQMYVDFMSQQDIPTVNATKVIGWHKNTYLIPSGVVIGDPMEFIGNGLNVHVQVSDTQRPCDAGFLTELLFHTTLLHDPSISLLALGWMLASIWAPKIRDKYKNQFPTLCLHGAPGTGKTTMAQTFMQHLFGNLTDYSGKTTPAVILRALAYINALPVLIDEYEVSEMPVSMNGILRSLWNRGSAQRMVINGNEQVLNLMLQAPVVLTNQAGVNDEAAQDRSVNLRLTAFDVQNGVKALKWFEKLPTGAFLKSWIVEDSTSWIENIERCRIIDGSERQRLAFGIAVAPLLHLAGKANFRGIEIKDLASNWKKHKTIGVSQIAIVDQLIAYLVRKFALLPRTPGYNVQGTKMYVMQAHFLDLAMENVHHLKLSYAVDRKWLEGVIKDGVVSGEILAQQKAYNLHGKTARCIILDLNKFLLTAEAVRTMEGQQKNA